MEKFYDVTEIQFDHMTNLFKIFRRDDHPEVIRTIFNNVNMAY